jgi:hypothetical protein
VHDDLQRNPSETSEKKTPRPQISSVAQRLLYPNTIRSQTAPKNLHRCAEIVANIEYIEAQIVTKASPAGHVKVSCASRAFAQLT